MEIRKLIAPLNEDEIKKHWIYTDRVYISSVCFTFNQKGYIRDTIDSFLAQETEYRFEIIIHDDASTDGTRDILLEYKNKYPSIIKLILQEENQYSQGKQIVPLGIEHADGEYIAFCEGDDYWIDKKKIDKQVKYLEKNKNIGVCFSSALGLYENGEIKRISNYKESKLYSFQDVVLGGGEFMPSPSLFFRKALITPLPKWFFEKAPVGDFYMQILTSNHGAYYFVEAMCIYRLNAVGSWSLKQKLNDSNKIDLEYERHVECLKIILANDYQLYLKAKSNIMCGKARQLLLKNEFYKSYKCYKKYLKTSTIRSNLKYYIKSNRFFIVAMMSILWLKYNK